MSRNLTCAAIILLLGSFVAVANAVEGPKEGTPVDTSDAGLSPVSPAIQTPATLLPGTIQYDTGVVNFVPGLGSVTWGNQFNTASGNPVTASGSVTQVQFYMVGVGGGSGFISMYGPVAGTTAPPIDSSLTSMVTGFNTKAYAQNYTGPSFLLGVWADSSPISDLVGIDGSTTGGQGFHGMIINDIVGTGFQTITANVIVRASGDLLTVPVELMSFTLDGE